MRARSRVLLHVCLICVRTKVYKKKPRTDVPPVIDLASKSHDSGEDIEGEYEHEAVGDVVADASVFLRIAGGHGNSMTVFVQSSWTDKAQILQVGGGECGEGTSPKDVCNKAIDKLKLKDAFKTMSAPVKDNPGLLELRLVARALRAEVLSS